jgi:uracil-DNA glycosylase family 4
MIVKDIGPPDARIIIVGEAPGREEEKKGEPFVGASGQLLKQMLRHVGIKWSECYVTNISNKRPERNDFGKFYEDKSRRNPTVELERMQHKLREKIRGLDATVVVTVGAEALRAVTGKRGIKDWRGCPLKLGDKTVIPTYHPAAVLRQYEFHPIVELDLEKAKRVSEDGLRNIRWHFTLEPNVSDVLEFLKSCKGKTVAFDLESIGKTVRCIGLAVENRTICIPFLKFKSYDPPTFGSTIIKVGDSSGSTSSYWSVADEHIVVTALAKFFKDPDIKKVGQNSLGFDQPFLEDEFGFVFENHTFDTMHAWHVLYPELPKGLSFLCSVLTDYPNYWAEKDVQDDMSEWTYNCWDTIVTLDAHQIMMDELKDEEGLLKFYEEHVHPLAIALANAQRKGVTIDLKIREKMLVTVGVDREKAQKRVREGAEMPELNLNSHPQLKDLLYNKLGYRPVTNRAGKISTDSECLNKLMKRYPSDPLFADIQEYRSCGKIMDFLNCKVGDDGRMHTSYNASGTKTGRISSSRTIWGEGMNLMNIPKSLRGMYLAPPGRIFVKEDLSQAETRVVAELLKLHGDPTLWEKYQDPKFDIHTWLASELYGKSEGEVSNYERQVGKIGNHSGNYRAGPKVLEATALKYGLSGITYNVARDILDKRGRALPGLARWWRWVEEELARTRTLWTCLGRRRIFFGRLDHQLYREATAFYPQSVVGDVNNIIFRELDRRLSVDCWPVLQVHDEVVIEGPAEKKDYMIDMMRKVGDIQLWINEDEPLTIPMDIGVGTDWKNMKEVKE